ncbi:phosphodiester glycosidase family protein [Neobacillus sp. M.A.Huq-85]|nr:phosphodiester glycosidase family protein [Neobacillus cucumis]
MELSTTKRNYLPRHPLKFKRGTVWRIFGILILLLFLSGSEFLYGTNKGHQLRRMVVGTVISSQHPQYVKYLVFLLPQSEIKELNQAMLHPPVKQSSVTPVITKEKKDSTGKKESIRVDTINTANFTAKVMVIPDPTTVHLIGTRYSDKGQPLSDLIKENNGVAGINGGGFYDPKGNGSGAQPKGIVIINGKVINSQHGYKVPQLVGAFLRNGEFITGNYSVNQLQSLGVRDAVSFGPQLIVNGQSQVTSNVDAAWGWAPRTAIGQAKNGSIVMIITDGRYYWNKTHRGATMSDMVHLFEKYNVSNAIAMDGGGSTTMIKDGVLQLKPATHTSVGMRYLPNAWVVIPH